MDDTIHNNNLYAPSYHLRAVLKVYLPFALIFYGDKIHILKRILLIQLEPLLHYR